jgi:ribonuclease G
MHTEILINDNDRETRIAIVEDQRLAELWVERADQTRMVGDIYKGVIQSMLSGVQAAFVDLGHERSGFLHASDMVPRRTVEEEEEHQSSLPTERIEELLRPGQEVLVQVIKEPMGGKGPRLTTLVSLPGRYSVLVPGGGPVGVSRRIQDQAERIRLRQLGEELVPEGVGLIVRTMAEGISKVELERDIRALLNQWQAVRKRSEGRQGPFAVHREKGVGTSVIRDLFGTEIDRLVVDNPHLFKVILRQLTGREKPLRDRIEIYDGDTPLFDYFGIEDEIDLLFERVVKLRSGGSLIIEQTEALVVIDVNSGSYSGGQDQEETVFLTNLEAAETIGRQLRLRDLGGIIVIDFIDMERMEHREQLVDRLNDVLKNDRAHTTVCPVSELGLVEMTRERVRQSWMLTVFEPCLTCSGTGRVMTLFSSALRLERRLGAAMSSSDTRRFTVHVRRDLLEYLRTEWNHRWVDLTSQAEIQLEEAEPTSVPGEGFLIKERA